MNTELFNKCLRYNFKSLFDKKGYAFFTNGEYNLNIIGVRSEQNNKVTNKFDDVVVIDYSTSKGHIRNIYPFTTEPGLYYMQNPLVKNGTAILVPGQYRGAYQIGIHRNYIALVQAKSVKVYRDGNKDKIYDLLPSKTENGLFAINIHRASAKGESKDVNKFSAGCQVFANCNDFDHFMELCQTSRKIYGNSFTYTLIDEKDLI